MTAKQVFRVEVLRVSGRFFLDVTADAPYVDETGRRVPGESVENMTSRVVAALLAKPDEMNELFDRSQREGGEIVNQIFIHDVWMKRSCQTCRTQVDVVLRDANNKVICGACACARGA